MDMLKQVSLAGKYKDQARLADLAAKEMARHCDKRIAAATKALTKIKKISNSAGNRNTLIDKIFWEAEEALTALSSADLDKGAV